MACAAGEAHIAMGVSRLQKKTGSARAVLSGNARGPELNG